MQRSIALPLFMLFINLCTGADAQTSLLPEQYGDIRGRLMQAGNGQPASDVRVVLPYRKLLVHSDAGGRFLFSGIRYGTYSLVIEGPDSPDTIRIYVHSPLADLGDVIVELQGAGQHSPPSAIPTIAQEGAEEEGDEGVRQAPVSGLLNASRDPFTAAAAFVFSAYRFRPRGYNRAAQEVLIAGLPMNDAETGEAYWSLWGGLNDAFRGQSQYYGLQPSTRSFGGIGGSVHFDGTASGQRKQTRFTYSLSNRSYRSRLMFSHSTGIGRKGWAYAATLSRRWANEGYIPGTFYDAWSWYAAVSKRLGTRQEASLLFFGAPSRRGKSAPLTQEAVDLAESRFYNPAWGFQQDRKRNARVGEAFQPVAILNYRFVPSRTTGMHVSIGYQAGRVKNSGLDYYNGRNPRPDYYRYMPSHYIYTNTDPANLNPGDQAEFLTQKQIDWEGIYAANSLQYDSIVNESGIVGNTVRGRRAVTVLYKDVEATSRLSLNAGLEKLVGAHFVLSAGLLASRQRTESYRELADLLGGDFYLNLNQFAFQQHVPDATFNQFDLSTPDRAVREGDKYNYNYISSFTKGALWLQAEGSFRRLDIFLAARGGYQRFAREGLYRNGLFAEASFGRSGAQQFLVYGLKGGATWKLDGRNYLFVHAACAQESPLFEHSYISPRYRNTSVDDPVEEKIMSLEGGYLMRSPKYNIRITGYSTGVADAAIIKRYYNDDPAFRGFVNYVMRGVGTRYTGLELAAEARLMSSLSVTAVAALGQAFYTENPVVAVFRDNDTLQTPVARNVYIRNYYLAVGPQSAYTLGADYRSRRYWYAGIRLNYLDRNYVDPGPDQRTEEAVAGIAAGSEQYLRILDQQMMPPAFTVDLSFGKSWLLSRYMPSLPRNTFLYLNAGISNVLDAVVYTGGFEQLRYDFDSKEPGRFAPRYFFGYGRNYFINLSLRF